MAMRFYCQDLQTLIGVAVRQMEEALPVVALVWDLL